MSTHTVRASATLTAGDLLHVMRTRGYDVSLADGELQVLRDKPTPDPARAAALLGAHHDELVQLLLAEQHPKVQAALTIFIGSRLVRVEKAPDRRLAKPAATSTNPRLSTPFHEHTSREKAATKRQRHHAPTISRT